MKFMWNGCLWVFGRDKIKFTDVYGDTYIIRLTKMPEGGPIMIEAIEKRDYTREMIKQNEFWQELEF